MQIIAIDTDPVTDRGGEHLTTFDMCRGLAQLGHQITLIYFYQGDLLPEYQKFCHKLIYLEHYRIDNKHPLKSALKIVAGVQRIMPELQIKRGNTVIYISNHFCALIAWLLGLFYRIPQVFHIRSGLGSEAIFHKQDRFTIKQMSHFIAVSQNTCQDWLKKFNLGEKNMTVIYNGTNTKLFDQTKNLDEVRQAWNLPKSAKIILYMGRIDRQKGLETLIEAFALLSPQTQLDIKLIIAGKPVGHRSIEAGRKYQEDLEQLTRDLKIDHQTNFIGHINQPVSLYQASDLSVLPSIYPEPFGRTIIESMACGVPVIASRIGGIPEILTGEWAQGLFEPGNAEDLAKKIQNMLNWRENNPQLGELSRSHILANFSIDKTLSQVEIVLQKVLNK